MRYDTTLKELLQSGAPRLWQAMIGDVPQEFLTVELPSVHIRKPDFVARLRDGVIVHLELQGDNDDEMVWRELEYYQLLHKLYRRPPQQYVLYFGPAQMNMENVILEHMLQFRYTLLDIRYFSAERLLESDALADNLLSVFSGTHNPAGVLAEVARRLGELPENERQDWFERLMILSGLRGMENNVREEAIKMGVSLDIRDNKFFQEIYAVGHEEGTKEGIEFGETMLLRRMLERRFGALPDWAVVRLEALDRAALEEAGLRLLDAATIEEVLGTQPN